MRQTDDQAVGATREGPGALLRIGLVVAALTGIGFGVGSYTFVYARGASYLTDDPGACANCHIMQDHYDAWLKGSHHASAVCNDCHTPKGFVAKYYTKSRNGLHHSWAFTTGWFHEPIQITAFNERVTEGRCRSCHLDIVEAIDFQRGEFEPVSCIRCHDSVGHFR